MAQHGLVDRFDVVDRRRHDVRLVLQRALPERQPHRRVLLRLTGEADVPPQLVTLAAIDGLHGGVLRAERRQPLVDLTLEDRQRGVVVDVGHAQATSSRTVRSLYVRRSRAAARLHVYRRDRAAPRRPRSAASAGSSRMAATWRANQRRVPVRHEEPALAVVDQREETTDAARDHRDAARRRFERDEPEALAAARDEHDVGGPVPGAQDVVRLRRHEPHLVAEAELVDQRVQLRHLLVAVRAARAADDHQQRIRSVQLGQGAHRHVRALQRLDPPDEQQDGDVERQVEGAPGPAAITRREERVLDPRGDHLDPAGGVAVQPAELALLLGAADADRVGAPDDLGLGPLAPHRLGVAALGLHLGERVERRDERQPRSCLMRWATSPLSQ